MGFRILIFVKAVRDLTQGKAKPALLLSLFPLFALVIVLGLRHVFFHFTPELARTQLQTCRDLSRSANSSSLASLKFKSAVASCAIHLNWSSSFIKVDF
jgi:hypothetical protein